MPLASVDRDNMGLDFGLNGLQACFPKFTNRWLFQIEGISATADALPPFKSSRPQLDFKEQQVAHLVQSVYFPLMVEWKPITLTLYDNKANKNPVFDWIKQVYDPNGEIEWRPVYSSGCSETTCFKRNALLCLYDGCGKVSETWKFENIYPQAVNFGELDMASANIVTIELTLRYDRAYIA